MSYITKKVFVSILLNLEIGIVFWVKNLKTNKPIEKKIRFVVVESGREPVGGELMKVVKIYNLAVLKCAMYFSGVLLF